MSADDDLIKKAAVIGMDTIGEESVSALPPPHTPLAAIPSREDIISAGNKVNNAKGKKGGK